MLEKEEEEEKDGRVKEEEDSGDGDLCRSLGTTTSKLHDEAACPPFPLKAAPNSHSPKSTLVRKLHQLPSALLANPKIQQHYGFLLWLPR